MKVGVIIGRFQVKNLHDGHKFIIDTAFQNHSKVLILVGVHEISGTINDPMDFPTRNLMIQKHYPDAIVLPILNRHHDELWSKDVDRLIKTVFPNVSEAHLYGGRKSFIPHYKGVHKAIEIDSGIKFQNGTDEREQIGKNVSPHEEFRGGIIYSTQNSFPYVKMCADMAVVRDDKILLGRKHGQEKWCFPGGMVEPKQTLEETAIRELKEETGVFASLGHVKYLSSHVVVDWRFQHIKEISVLTSLFLCQKSYNDPVAGDDLEEVGWFPLREAENTIIDYHLPLLENVLEYLYPTETYEVEISGDETEVKKV